MARILIIGDEPSWIDAVEESLKKDDYELIAATNGEEGFKKAVAELPDLILEDNLKINNRFLWEELKEDPRTKDIKKILFVTIGVDQKEIFRRGAVDCITKPFDEKELKRKVASILNPPIFIKVGEKTIPITDPFDDITLDMAKEISLKEYKKIFELIKDNYANKIEDGFKNGETEILLCDGKVVATSNDPEGLLTVDRINKIEKEKGKICYIFSRNEYIEEISTSTEHGKSKWNIVYDEDDWYPTVTISLGKSEWTWDEIVRNGVEIIADFDTGNPILRHYGYLAFPDRFREKIGEEKGIRGFADRFNNPCKSYGYFKNNVKIGVVDINGTHRCENFNIRFVEDNAWRPAFQEGHDLKRDGFIGRELFFKLLFSITLNPKTRISTIQLLEK